MNSELKPKSYVIVIGVDYSDAGALALTEAVRLARLHAQSHLHLVHAISGMPPLGQGLSGDLTVASGQPVNELPPALAADLTRDMMAYVEKVLGSAGAGAASTSTDSLKWTTHVRLADAAPALAQVASDVEADLVVVGTHGRRGLARFLLGSVAEGVVRLAPCPVLVMRPVGAAAESDAPKIEPPCQQCLEVRQASNGAQFWCERHSERHSRAHTYHFTPFRDAHQSGLLLHPNK